MHFDISPKGQDYLNRVKAFIKNEIEPCEAAFWSEVTATCHGGDWRQWQVPTLLQELKAKARSQGLWNMFLPDETLGAGLSIKDYALIAEQTGRSLLAPIVFNSNAADSFNMEVLWRYGSEEQKQRWLMPLLNGEIRSVFCMSEPQVAFSDSTKMQATAVVEGDKIVLNGRKWWSSGIGDPHAKLAIFMARTPDASKDRRHQHSMVLVPLDAPGVKIERMVPVFGEYDAPQGYGEASFNNVQVPLDHFISGPGMGFEIAKERLGPSSIHHCMRCIGAAEKALKLAIDRGMQRVAFGKPLLNLGRNRARVAEARMAINKVRLQTVFTAWKMDRVGALIAITDISAIKVAATTVLRQMVDFAIQMQGGASVSRDVTLTASFNLRLADGHEETHKSVIVNMELAKSGLADSKGKKQA